MVLFLLGVELFNVYAACCMDKIKSSNHSEINLLNQNNPLCPTPVVVGLSPPNNVVRKNLISLLFLIQNLTLYFIFLICLLATFMALFFVHFYFFPRLPQRGRIYCTYSMHTSSANKGDTILGMCKGTRLFQNSL